MKIVKVTIKDVEHVAALARLGLSEDEKNRFKDQLSRILEHAETINGLDTKNVEPTSHTLHMSNVFREDKSVPCTVLKEIMNNAPSSRDNMFSVPRIME